MTRASRRDARPSSSDASTRRCEALAAVLSRDCERSLTRAVHHSEVTSKGVEDAELDRTSFLCPGGKEGASWNADGWFHAGPRAGMGSATSKVRQIPNGETAWSLIFRYSD